MGLAIMVIALTGPVEELEVSGDYEKISPRTGMY